MRFATKVGNYFSSALYFRIRRLYYTAVRSRSQLSHLTHNQLALIENYVLPFAISLIYQLICLAVPSMFHIDSSLK